MELLYNQIGSSGERRGDVKMQRSGDNAIIYTIQKFENDEWVDDGTKTPLTANISQPVTGVTINGNVYGGGNEADVTKGTDVQIGKKPAVAQPAPSPAPQRNNTQPSGQTTTPAPTQNQNTTDESGFTRTVTPVRR
jgi:hypothetical protein